MTRRAQFLTLAVAGAIVAGCDAGPLGVVSRPDRVTVAGSATAAGTSGTAVTLNVTVVLTDCFKPSEAR